MEREYGRAMHKTRCPCLHSRRWCSLSGVNRRDNEWDGPIARRNEMFSGSGARAVRLRPAPKGRNARGVHLHEARPALTCQPCKTSEPQIRGPGAQLDTFQHLAPHSLNCHDPAPISIYCQHIIATPSPSPRTLHLLLARWLGT